MTETKNKNLISRPPVVVVVGHIDHGKSTLLDYIRRTNTTEKEAGGITQHISAYEAECEVGGEKRKITFLDTPGHEAFCSIRERGTKVADIAVLVVSAEDGVKPQTIEALNCIKNDNIPFVVAINKIDRPNANIEKTKQDLAEHEVLVEGWGGTVPMVAISAKTGEKVPELLEMICLQADLEELTGDPSVPAEGFVIESRMSPKQGISASLIIKNGTLKVGMFVGSRGAFAPVRAIENHNAKQTKEASFSSPVKIVGWNATPAVGDEFKTFLKKEEAIEFSKKNNVAVKSDRKIIPEGYVSLEIVLKADTFGSLDAVEHELEKLDYDKVMIRIISKGIGNIGENDLKTAQIKNSLILGFNISPDKVAEALALRENIEIKTFKIIYELTDFVKEKIKSLAPEEKVKTVLGVAKILKIFSKNKDKQVAGGRVETGELKAGNLVEIFRRDILIGTGKIKEIQIQKIKGSVVKEGQEFGLMIESKIELAGGDFIKASDFVAK